MRKAFLLLCVYLLPSLAFATKRLAVFEFRGIGIEEVVLTILSDAVRTGVLDVTQGEKVYGEELLVMTREDMMDLIAQKGKSVEDCWGECEVELARNIGADYVILGEVAKLGELYVLKVKLYETNREGLLATKILKTKDTEELIEGAKEKGGIISKKGLNIQQSQPQRANTTTNAQTIEAEVKEKEIRAPQREVPGSTVMLVPLRTVTLIPTHKMMFIPDTDFELECRKRDNECSSADNSVHEVEQLRSFYMSQTEVTQGLWTKVMGSNPSYFSSCGDDCPVESVSWYEAIEFLNKLSAMEGLEQCYEDLENEIHFKGMDCKGYRLPTEAEWEYAARGGEDYIYAGGSKLSSVGWYLRNSGGKTHPVCKKKKNGYGLCDMSGNVFEWVWDWEGDYPYSKEVDLIGPEHGPARVGRGGSWGSFSLLARVSYLYYDDPSYSFSNLGFRLARSSL